MNIREKRIEAMAEESWTEDMAAMLDAALAVLADPENWTKVKSTNQVVLSWDMPPFLFDGFAAVINHVSEQKG